MSTFTARPNVDLLPQRQFRVARYIDYHVGTYPSKEVIRAPVGFITDLASIPSLLWPWYPPHGDYAPSAIIHDWLCKTGGLWGRYTRYEANQIFDEGNAVLGVPSRDRKVLLAGVNVVCRGSFPRSQWHPLMRYNPLLREVQPISPCLFKDANLFGPFTQN
jgi:hypothetical protein